MGLVIPGCNDSISGGGGNLSNPYVAFREQFTGDGSTTTFQLTGAVENGTFTQGVWTPSQVNTVLGADAVNQQGKPIYKTVILGIGVNRIFATSISPTGLVTTNFAPRNETFDIWYWYQLGTNDVIDDYVKEDYVASMEADWDDLEAKINTKISKVPLAGLDNVATWNATGEVKDSGVPIANVSSAITNSHVSGSETLGGDASGTVSNATVNKIQNRSVEITTTKGDIWVDDGTQLRRLAVGADGTQLVADSSQTLGVKWDTTTSIQESKTIQGTRNKKVTNSYLESGGVFMNLVPVITEKAYVLKSITMASETVNTWTVEIRDNGVLIPSASLTVTAGLNNEASGLNITIPIGSKLMFYVNGTLVQQPRVIITMIN